MSIEPRISSLADMFVQTMFLVVKPVEMVFALRQSLHLGHRLLVSSITNMDSDIDEH